MTLLTTPLDATVAELRRLGGPVFDALARSGTSVLVTDPRAPDNPVIFANAAFEALTGYSVADMLGRNCRFLQAVGADTATTARLRNAIAEGQDISVELLNRRKDSRLFWNALHIAPIRDEHGDVAFFLATQADVTASIVEPETRGALESTRMRLAETQGRLRAAQITVGAAGAWEWDVAENRLTGDSRFAALTGLDPVEAVNGLAAKAFFSTIHPDDVMRVRIAIAGAMHGAELFARDYRVVQPDGTLVWVAARGRSHMNPAGDVVRIAGVLSDITDQKRIQEQLNVAQTAGGVGTFEYLSGFGTAQVSNQFCSLLGLQAAEALPVRTINSVVHPDDPPLLGGAEDQALGPSFRELRIRRADSGDERWLARRGENLRDGLTTGVRFVGVVYDVTPAKLAQAKLIELTAALEERVEVRTQERDRVWNLSQDLLAIVGPDGAYRSVNPAWRAVLGRSEAEVMGARFDAFVAADDMAGLLPKFRGLASGATVQEFDCRMTTADGSLRWISWTVTANDRLYYATGRDVTLRKQLEDQLRQSQKMEAIGQLTGGLAHDFNNMLTGVIGGMDLVRKRIAEGRPNDVGRFIDTAMSSALRAAALTQRLLAFARRQSLDSHTVDVNELVLSMEDLLRRTLGEQVRLETNFAASAWPVLADSNQLESAILNLAINARDAMPDGGTLTVTTRNVTVTQPATAETDALAPGDYLEIGITDTGIGMLPEVVAKVFDPFYTTKPIGQGTGLGLSMVYGFVQQSKGNIEIESRIGQGTTISLFLPRSVAQAIDEETPERTAQHGTGETILVVEDDEAVRFLVLNLLDELGYSTAEAPDGQAALAILQTLGAVDLLISDVGLPGMNGRQLAEIVREARPNLPILFMTGYAPGATVRTEFLAPGMDMIAKPFQMDALAAKIREMLTS